MIDSQHIRPNLWITGLPKAGTSSLFSNLEEHPAIIGSSPKESFFLLDRNSPLINQKDNYWRRGDAGWTKFFPGDIRRSVRYALEGTTHLFFQEESLKVLKAYADSKFIIMLREPAERIHSSFMYTRDTLVRMPAHVSFNQYVADLLEGHSLNYVTHPVSRYVLSQELEYGSYHKFLQRWYDAFSPERVFVGLFEDLVSDNSAFMERLFKFLEVKPIAVSASHRNPSVAYKRPAVHRLLLQGARLLPKAAGLKSRLKEVYLKRFSMLPIRDEHDKAAKDRLKEYFTTKNQRLISDFSLDLTKWS